MRKLFFRKMLALLLIGVTLAWTGCKSYDDDIDRINNRIDELTTGKLASMEEQIAALQKSVDNMKGVQDQMQKLIDELKTSADANAAKIKALEDAQKKLADQIAAINSSLGSYASKSYVDQTFATINSVKAVADAIANIQKALGNYASKEDMAKAIQDAVDAAKTDLTTTLGKAMEDALKGYVTTSELQALQDQIDGVEGKVDDLTDRINAIENEFDKNVKDIVKQAIEENNGIIDEKIAQAISDATQALKDEIEKLQIQIDELVARIQSLVFVPDYDDGKATVESYTLGGTPVSDMTTAMTFRVSPASLASGMGSLKLNEQLSLAIREVSTRAASTEPITANILYVDGIDATEGTFTVHATISGDLVKDGMALALAINDKADANDKIYNERSSEYVQTVINTSKALDGNFALVDEEGEVLGANVKEYSKSWDKAASSEVKLLDGYQLMVKLSSGDYVSIEDAVKAGIKIGKTGYTVTNKYYNPAGTEITDKSKILVTVTPTKVTSYTDRYTAKMNKDAASMKTHVGEYMLTSHSFTVNNGKKDVAVTVPSTKYLITNMQSGVTLDAMSHDWTYSYVKALGSSPIVFDEVAVTANSTAFKINEILAQPCSSLKVTVEGKEVNGVNFVITPVASGVAEIVKVAMSGNYSWGKTYDFEAIYTVATTDIVISGSVKLGASPKDVEYSFSAKTLQYASGGISEKLASNYNDIYAKVEAGMFKDAAEFTTALFTNKSIEYSAESSNKDVTVSDATKLSVANNKIEAVIAIADIKASGDVITYTTVITTEFGMKVTLTFSATVTMPSYALVAEQAYLKNSIATVKGSINSTTGAYEIENANMNKYFSINPVVKSGDNVTIEYTTLTKATAQNGLKNVPQPVDGVIKWGNYNGLELQMRASLMIDGVVLGKVDYKIITADPLENLTAKDIVRYRGGLITEDNVNIWGGMSLKDIHAHELIDAKAPVFNSIFAEIINHKTAADTYNAVMTFGTATFKYADGSDAHGMIEFDAAKGVVTLLANDTQLVQEIIATVDVKLNYTFGTRTAKAVVRFSPTVEPKK